MSSTKDYYKWNPSLCNTFHVTYSRGKVQRVTLKIIEFCNSLQLVEEILPKTAAIHVKSLCNWITFDWMFGKTTPNLRTPREAAIATQTIPNAAEPDTPRTFDAAYSEQPARTKSEKAVDVALVLIIC